MIERRLVLFPADGPPQNEAEGPASAPESGSIFFVGTATVVLRYRGFTILTDPNFLHRGERVHLGYGLHATRVTEPAIALRDLPDVDLVLLSHMHEDHFDRKVARELDRSLPIVSTPHAVVALERQGFTATRALSTWERLEVVKMGACVHVSAMPGLHGPRLVASLLPPVMGSLLEFERPGRRPFRLYISGDTLAHAFLREIPRRFGEIDLAVLHLGGTRVLGVLATMDAAQGVRALRMVSPKRAIPVHYDDYTVFKSPLDEFRREVAFSGLEDRVSFIERGQTLVFEPSDEGVALRPS